ncbi:lysophospholipase [Lophiotrema nucula]|uniref:Lysophospholipase n=1 Tax=Lophiotrema nucula TaxID=690887 RepID=A0A6A5YEY7_9PLEO|nr:lysophospholipase [Lophiotrema nucula]
MFTSSYSPEWDLCPLWNPPSRYQRGSRNLEIFQLRSLPLVGLATSGGGYRSMPSGAGVVQAFDSRESSSTHLATSGLYQALTYHSGLSGGSWLLSSLAGNNFPTISELTQTYWNSILSNNPLSIDPFKFGENYTSVAKDVFRKYIFARGLDFPGLRPTLTDPWGRLISYGILPPTSDPGLVTLSSVAAMPSFTGYNAPFPIITALGVNTWLGEGVPGVAAFAPTQYIGTPMNNGNPASDLWCVTNIDNLGWIAGTSSNLFNVCAGNNSTLAPCEVADWLEEYVYNNTGYNISLTTSTYANYTNPFQNYASSTLVSEQSILQLVDGGQAGQNNPVWPFIQPERGVDVLFVNDNSADIGDMVTGGYPDGSELYTTYVQAKDAGLTKMPAVPLTVPNTQATFFGCYDADKLTIIYLPNNNFTYNSGTPTWKFTYTQDEVAGMIQNGNAIANQNGAGSWGFCLACGLMAKSGAIGVPGCQTCLDTFCWKEE